VKDISTIHNSLSGDRKGIGMRTIVITVLALLVGFLIGIKLSEVIGIIGVLGFARAIGIKYLPVYTAIAFAILANLADALFGRRSGRA
jgi:hypothetical protein